MASGAGYFVPFGIRRFGTVSPAALRIRLIVEIDGGQHADNSNDVVRDSYLKGEGFRILRFWNNDVLQNTRGVLETIYSALGTLSPGALRAPFSLFRGEGKER